MRSSSFMAHNTSTQKASAISFWFVFFLAFVCAHHIHLHTHTQTGHRGPLSRSHFLIRRMGAEVLINKRFQFRCARAVATIETEKCTRSRRLSRFRQNAIGIRVSMFDIAVVCWLRTSCVIRMPLRSFQMDFRCALSFSHTLPHTHTHHRGQGVYGDTAAATRGLMPIEIDKHWHTLQSTQLTLCGNNNNNKDNDYDGSRRTPRHCK